LPKNTANKKWFDKECRIKRHQLRKIANKKHIDPSNNEIRNLYHSTLKDYKHTLEMKKNKFHQDKLEELENATNDPILF
jgi:ribosomal protein L19E